MLENGDAAPAELHGAISCYTCKAPFTTLHAFYANLCPACAALNWGKRDERCDLAGRGALVTGARVKIGFRVALKLLRCGARVVATTRYPADCASRFNGGATRTSGATASSSSAATSGTSAPSRRSARPCRPWSTR
ncbi:short chain dehydrogenase [Aureococcus anophagefferens]|nr:short chain dehydrogenase [Aureococcus anophagefferens]